MTEITQEQRAAWEEIQRDIDPEYVTEGGSAFIDVDAIKMIAPLLPSELTNPQPVLPTEPGAYLSPTNMTIVLTEYGDWMHGDELVATATVQAMLPLVPLLPERAQVTRDEAEAIAFEIANHPVWELRRTAVRFMPDLVGPIADVIMTALENGTDRD